MTLASYLFGIVAAVLIFVVVIEMLRRHQLRERHATWWLIAGTLALVGSVFPVTVTWASRIVGVELPVNLVFFVSLIILFLVCLQQSAELTSLEAKTRTLVEVVAMQDLRIRALEAASASGSAAPAARSDHTERTEQPRPAQPGQLPEAG
ncbi:DUF2304 domain-containing protein [Cryobacterium frigoriphilum]|uniref:DUF2304 domain-containing protein n=1 Tax=Cryobacterium frigoriphilum TaxID=1259150 RepID=A0A4R9A2C2_9MICO|nr:DUF2304 domain-containing protein [Cryobacterium frigoriphilum]TFD50806.1 DUF2304 domain-containing protein [Cryobacterium frigoriphilum]